MRDASRVSNVPYLLQAEITRYESAMRALNQCQWEEAEALFRGVLESGVGAGTSLPASVRRGYSYLKAARDECAEARELLRQAAEIDRQNLAGNWAGHAYLDMLEGNAEALRLDASRAAQALTIDRLVSTQHNQMSVLAHVARSLLELGYRSAAHECLESTHRIRGMSASEVEQMLASGARVAGTPRMQRGELDKTLALNLCFVSAGLQRYDGALDEAEETLKRIDETEPEARARVCRERARIAWVRGDPAAAQRHYDAALAIYTHFGFLAEARRVTAERATGPAMRVDDSMPLEHWAPSARPRGLWNSLTRLFA